MNENHIKSHQAGTLTAAKVSACYYVSSVTQIYLNKHLCIDATQKSREQCV